MKTSTKIFIGVLAVLVLTIGVVSADNISKGFSGMMSDNNDFRGMGMMNGMMGMMNSNGNHDQMHERMHEMMENMDDEDFEEMHEQCEKMMDEFEEE